MKSTFNKIVIVACILLITSCGFRLRGSGASYALSPQLTNLELNGSNLNSDLMHILQNNLASSGININGEQAGLYTLTVIDQGISERNTTFGSDARTTEKEVKAKATFTLKSKDGEYVYGPHDLENERIYNYDVSSVNAADREKALIIAELRRNLADQILRMIQAIKLPGDEVAPANNSSAANPATDNSSTNTDSADSSDSTLNELEEASTEE